MVDLHSHALFGIDDGARTIEHSTEILRRAKKIGIDKMALTPHFTIGDDVEEFLQIRNENFEMLKSEAEDIGVDIVCGAEVYMTDEIFNETELDKLTIGKSKTVLCEFKYHGLSGETFLEYVDYVKDEGLDVLVAHPERYSYLRRDRFLLEALWSRDVKLQVNAISLYEDSSEGEFARMLVKNNLAYCIGSDIHHASSRRFAAMESLCDKGRYDMFLSENPEKIFVKD